MNDQATKSAAEKPGDIVLSNQQGEQVRVALNPMITVEKVEPVEAPILHFSWDPPCRPA